MAGQKNTLLLIPGMLILFVAMSIRSDAQSVYIIDSLRNILTTARTDSARVATLTELALVYGNGPYNIPAGLKSCDSAWHIATRSRQAPLKLKCYIRCIYAQLYRYANDSLKCKQNIQEAEKIAEELGDSVLFGLVYHQKGMYCKFLSQEKKKLDYLLRSADLLKNTNYHKTMLMNYHNITLVFQRLGDYHTNLVYARKAFPHALNPNDRILAYYNGAGAHINLGFSGAGFEKNIDSAVYMLKEANRLIKLHRKRVKDVSLLANVPNYLGRLYTQENYEYVYNLDSAIHYLEEGRDEAIASGDKMTYASSSLILAKYAMDANNIKKAERLLKEAKGAYYNDHFNDRPLTEGDLYLMSTFLYEKKGMYREAIANYKRYMGIRDTIYNKGKLNSIQNTEAKFLLEKKEQEIRLLKEREASHNRSIYFSLALSCIALLLLVLLYRSHTFRRKFFSERQKLLEEQSAYALLKKEEAEHALRLETEDSKRLEVERQLQANQKEQFQKELMTSVLHLERKNDLFLRLKESIISFRQNMIEIRQVHKLIDENLDLDTDFGRFSKNFELVYPNFFSKLQQRSAENLTQLDLRYCAYIQMGLSSKEMSNLLNVDPASIRKARYRLKQKLNLGKEDDLNDFINSQLLTSR
jgi:DNA-binding CsgD family transcriptional regulator